MLPQYKILDPSIDRLPAAALRAIQSQRLVTMVRYVYEYAPFWQAKFQTAGLTPVDIRGLDDLPRIPFCTKEELQRNQAEHPPFGNFTCSPPTHWAHFVTTSGTTGQPLRRLFSERDMRYILDRFQRRGAPVGPGDIAMVLGPTDGLMGPAIGVAALERQGVMVVRAGLLSTAAKLKLIVELRPKLLMGTASYLLHLAEVARAEGIDLSALGLKGINSVGEPGAAVEATNQRLRQAYGVERVGDGYGMTELFPLGGNCPFESSLHLADDMAICEVVDPESGCPLPPGEVGELVFTNLVGDTQPLLRYRSRDIGRISAPGDVCRCGFTGTRILGSIAGRVDDMIWYRGVNVYPSAIEAAVREDADAGDEFRIIIRQTGNELPVMTIQAEAAPGLSASRWGALSERLRAAVTSRIRVHSEIEILPHGTLPRISARDKARRVIDQRRVARP